MLTQKRCPTCGAVHTVELTHEFKTVDHQKSLEMIFVGQSTQHDSGKLEWLAPYATDGQELRISATRMDERQVLIVVTRVPVTEAAKAMSPAAPTAPKSRVDMLTDAAESGLKVNPKWTDLQLAQALADHKAKLQPA